MQSTKVPMNLWARCKKATKLPITLDPGDAEDTQGVEGNTEDNYTRGEMSFNSLMAYFFWK